MFLDLTDRRIPAYFRTSPDVQNLATQGYRPFYYPNDGTLGMVSPVPERLHVATDFAPAIETTFPLSTDDDYWSREVDRMLRKLGTPPSCDCDNSCDSCRDSLSGSETIGIQPDPQTLRRSLLSYFQQSTERGTACKPLNRWHPTGSAFLAGYAAVWDVATCKRPGGHRLLMRQGTFHEVLAKKSNVGAWVSHKSKLAFASTKAGTLALVEDQHGLACFIDPTGAPNGEALTACVHRGELAGMSMQLNHESEHFTHNGQAYREVKHAETLTEVSLCPEGCNPAALAIAVNYKAPQYDTSGSLASRAHLMTLATA